MPVNFRSMTPGLGQLAQAIAGGDTALQRGRDDELSLQSKIAQQLASMRQADAAARHYDAQSAAEQAKTAVLGRRPAQYEEQVALGSGTSVPTVQAFRQKVATGVAPQGPMGPPTEDGTYGVGSVQFDPQQVAGITRELQRLAPFIANTGDLDPDKLAKAREIDHDIDLSGRLEGGQANPITVALSRAAMKGELPYQTNETGAVLNRYSGGLDTGNPMAASTINLRKEQAGAQRANAAHSYASADASRASAGKYRAETGEINAGRGPSGKAPSGYRWNPDGSLQVIPGGPADAKASGGKPLTEGQAKANMFGTRMSEANRIFDDMEAAGADRPGWWKRTLEATAGAVPIVGDSLSDGVGAATNWTQSDAQQQVEQAQRDFINAVLRRESGAVISPTEFANARKQYFPMVGDSPAVIAQKKGNRELATRTMLDEVPEGQRTPLPERPTKSPAGGLQPTRAPASFHAPGRDADADFTRVVEGLRNGYNPSVIASNMAKAGYPPEAIRLVIQQAGGQ